MAAFIKDIAYWLPPQVVSNEQLVGEFPEWSVGKIAEKVGVEERRVAGEMTATDMAVEAAERLFAQGTVRREDVDFVLLCTQSPDYKLPSSSCIIQHRLGLSDKCGAFDFNLGCSGYEYGLAVAKGLIAAGVTHGVLLLTAETYTKYLHQRDKGNRTIFGDGASATLVAEDGFAEIGEFCLGTDGSMAESLIVRTGGARHPMAKNDVVMDEGGNPVSSDHLFMDGKDIFAFTLQRVPKMVRSTIERNGLTAEDINLYVFHQASRYMLEHLRHKLKISEERFFVNMAKVGNTVSSTIPIALCDARSQGKLKGNVLLAGFGVGLSWGATIINVKL